MKCLITVSVHQWCYFFVFFSTQINLRHVFKMSAFGTHASFELCMPLVNGYVNVLFGLLRVNSDIFFTPRNQSQLRGHAYMLHKQRYFTFNRRNFFSIRINMRNSLPPETTDFSGLDKFNKSVSNMFLLNFCQVNFVWISPCNTETYIVRFYVFTCMIVMFLSLTVL